MIKHRKHGLSDYLNKTTRNSIPIQTQNEITQINIDEIIPNPDNFYGTRDIDSLAALISISDYIEPLEVKKVADHKYMLIAGHRRRLAKLKLLEDGSATDRTVPCIIRNFDDKGCLTAFEVEKCSMIFSNKGQRKERTVDEQLEEIRILEPIAKKIYDEEHAADNIKGNFRKFFAEEILNTSSTALQRTKSLEKLTDKAKDAVNNGKISETAAAELAGLPIGKQDQFVDDLDSGNKTGTVDDIRSIKSTLKAEKPKPEKFAEFEPEESDEISELENEGQIPLLNSHRDFHDNVSTNTVENKNADNLAEPEKEAQKWLANYMLPLYEQALYNAQQMKIKAESKKDAHEAAQWNVRVSVTELKIIELKERK
ncbi:ParB/RepB/Spo0J family partition protein [Pectinatus frisingensis]|uniref:ParB/RepB/Spo0J family partition protein n=1 Tax=Pectinatus frisingensis TaxID=865 RepID=UPI0018C5BC6D|nr:ParB N-terminal domain-containing protein [Pectinatus frisingensis]